MSFGQTTVAGATPTNMSGQSSARLVYGRSYTPSVAESITSVRAYLDAGSITVDDGLLIGIFDITGGYVGATRVALATVVIPVGASAGWRSIDISYSMTVGHEYAYAFVAAENSGWNLYASAVGGSGLIDRDDSGSTPYGIASTWPSGGGGSSFDALVEVITAVDAAQTIDTVNSGNPVKIGQTFTSSVAGFTGVVSGTLGGISLTGLSYSSNTITATLPSFIDGDDYFEPDINQTLVFNNGSETASKSVSTASPNDMASVVIADADTANVKNITHYIPSISDDDRIVFPLELDGDDLPTFNIDTDGSGTALTTGLRVLWLWNNEDAVMTQLNVTINEVGGVVGVVVKQTPSLGIGFGIGI